MGRTDGSGRECLILKFKNNFERAKKNRPHFIVAGSFAKLTNLLGKIISAVLYVSVRNF